MYVCIYLCICMRFLASFSFLHAHLPRSFCLSVVSPLYSSMHEHVGVYVLKLCVCIYMCVCMCICVSVSVTVSACLCICLSVSISMLVSVSVPVCIYARACAVSVSVSLPVLYLTLCLYLCLRLRPGPGLYLCTRVYRFSQFIFLPLHCPQVVPTDLNLISAIIVVVVGSSVSIPSNNCCWNAMQGTEVVSESRMT